MKTTLGGERLGSGSKNVIATRNYERSTHDLGYLWRSTMAAGTLVPFMNLTGLPGDVFDIELDADAMTGPTVGPLFGSEKLQLDVFMVPMRLYNAKLQMNMLKLGFDMKNVFLPQIRVGAKPTNDYKNDTQVEPSCLLHYLGISGVGRPEDEIHRGDMFREFNAVPFLAYYDIVKQYYSDKQIGKGYMLCNKFDADFSFRIVQAYYAGAVIPQQSILGASEVASVEYNDGNYIDIILAVPKYLWGTTGAFQIEPSYPILSISGSPNSIADLITSGGVIEVEETRISEKLTRIRLIFGEAGVTLPTYAYDEPVAIATSSRIARELVDIYDFDLEEIDRMRIEIMADVKGTDRFLISGGLREPESWGLPYGWVDAKSNEGTYWITGSQTGLCLKTYQSDLFNNWLNSEWIDGENGINDITSVAVVDGKFSIPSLIVANKIFEHLNMVAVSDGTYDSWLDASYGHERLKAVNSPVYMGSLIKEISFEQVISNAATEIDGVKQPLGELGGRGRLTGKHKGGKIKIKCDEPCVVLGIVSITPRIDYSQGNKWDTNLKSIDDLHKPILDEIGFQSLITDQMAYFDTEIAPDGNLIFKEAGKQPAWINYMTAVNECHGNFAVESKEMFMTFNRRYEYMPGVGIDDLTTYIDPVKYNYIFADTRLDAQNHWVQIAVDCTARRKMSAKVMPNL